MNADVKNPKILESVEGAICQVAPTLQPADVIHAVLSEVQGGLIWRIEPFTRQGQTLYRVWFADQTVKSLVLARALEEGWCLRVVQTYADPKPYVEVRLMGWWHDVKRFQWGQAVKWGTW